MPDARPDLPVPGDLIWIRRRQWRVTSTQAGDGLSRLVVTWVDGWRSAQSRTFLLPCERWSHDIPRHSRPVSSSRGLAWLAACTARAHTASVPGSIVNGQAEILGYQLEPALAMLAGKRRVLIADAVGLGKTIQAAVMVAETLRRCADARVLVMAPASLLTQWSGELSARFGVTAQLADAGSFARLRSERAYLNNPWRGPGVWLASPDYLKQAHVIDAMPRVPFDLVVIDEAHTMAGNSQRHSAADAIARAARHLVMLTATPHDGDETRFRRLMALGSTGSLADSVTIFRRTRTGRARQVRRLAVNPGSGLSQVLAAIDSFARAGRSGAPSDGLLLICGVFRKRALSSLAALAASLTRRLAIIGEASGAEPVHAWIQPGLDFGDDAGPGADDGDVMSSDEWSVLRGVTGLPADRERAWLQRLIGVASRAGSLSGNEPKLARLASLLERSKEAVVVFTEYRDSLLAIAAAVTRLRQISVLHGGLPGSEQRRALAAFLDGPADVLLATDVASQGLNLQHRARWIVHFDLPWTPMRLEQRVGRVDRIGQTRPVHVTVIGIRHQAEVALRDRVAARRDASEAAPLPNCTRWRRAAEGLARWFARQRALAAHWRGPDPLAVPRARVTTSTLRRLGLDLRQAQVAPGVSRGETQAELHTLVEIPLVTDAGEVIERCFGWHACGATPAHAGAGLTPALTRRARALGGRARRRLARLQAAQASGASRALLQPGLFGPRDPVGTADAAATTPPQTNLTVHVGLPRPLLILHCPIEGKERRG